MAYDYDMIVLGGGAAGLVAAGMSASLGAKTALIEEDRLGGDCTWTGCVPSKTLLAAAKLVHHMRTADRYGLRPVTPELDFRRVAEHVRVTRQHIYEEADAPPNLEKHGVAVMSARACFMDPHTVRLACADGRCSRLTSRFFVIATGSRPRMLDVAVPQLTNETIFELNELPRRLLVTGAGPIGIEMAQAFRRLGAEVTVVAPEEHILRKDDPELTAILERALKEEDIRLLLGHKVVRLEEDGGCTRATLENGQLIECDAVLAAIGRASNVEALGLDRAGVELQANGVRIDRHCRTSQRHIYASGDVTGKLQFTHMAEHMSRVAVSNAILRLPLSLDERHVVWCTYTDPELSRLGASETDLGKQGRDYRVYRFPFAELDRAVTESETTGLVKVLATKGGRILGASILGAQAGEMIAEYALAMKNGLSLRKISDTIHPYPTYMLGNRRAADLWYIEKRSPRLVRLLQILFGYRGPI